MRRKFTNLCEYIKAHIKCHLKITFLIFYSRSALPQSPLQSCISPAGFAVTVVKDSRQLNNETALYSSFLFSTGVTDGIITNHTNQRTEKTLTSPKPQDNSRGMDH